jgi:hypothetical protein
LHVTQFATLCAALRTFLNTPVLKESQMRAHTAASLLGMLTPTLDITNTGKWRCALDFLAELLRVPPTDGIMYTLLATRIISVVTREMNRLPAAPSVDQIVAAQYGCRLLRMLTEARKQVSNTTLSLVDIIAAVRGT